MDRERASIQHPVLGALAFEHSAFAIDGRTGLSMVIYNPATEADAEKIRKAMWGSSLQHEKPRAIGGLSSPRATKSGRRIGQAC
jgi:hypothetical protein